MKKSFPLLMKCEDLVMEVIEKFQTELILMAYKNQFVKTWNEFKGENFSIELERKIDRFYLSRLKKIQKSFILISEQSGIQYINKTNIKSKYLIIIDPLDTTEFAIRALFGYTHLCIIDIRTLKPILSIVGDFFHFARMYSAYSIGSKKSATVRLVNGKEISLKCSNTKTIRGAVITSFSAKPNKRYSQIFEQKKLMKKVSCNKNQFSKTRVLIDFGSIGFCHIAAGLTDAMIEIAKGFRMWDYLPGKHILETAGGHVWNTEEQFFKKESEIQSIEEIVNLIALKRIKFIAAGTKRLIEELKNAIEFTGE